MAVPWPELGAALFLSGLLVGAVDAPAPVIAPADVVAHEGRTVRVTGFVDDVQIGMDSHRGVLVADGHAVRFQADGLDAPEDDKWVELRGTLVRDGGWLVLHVEPDPWTW